MSSYAEGDVVSLSRAQVSQFTVLASPPGPGPSTYTVFLDINGAPTPYSLQAQPGTSITAIAAGLYAVLVAQQTVYAVQIDPMVPWAVDVAGPIGATYGFSVGDPTLLLPSLVRAAVQSINSLTGAPLGPIRISQATNTLERLREFASRDRAGNLIPYINMLHGRELDTSNEFDFPSTSVLSVLSTAAGGLQSPFSVAPPI